MEEAGLGGATAESKSYLMEALAKAQERARAVLKDGDDPRYGKGTLASTETIIQVVKAANAGLGISFRPKECPIIRDTTGIIAIKRVLIVGHTSGESFEVSTEWPVVLKTNRDGKASQTWDDAIATAQTRSLGYLLRDTWGLPRLKEEDMPPIHGDAEAAEPEVSPWEAQRTEWNAVAKAAIKAGVDKKTVIDEVRRRGGNINDAGVWAAAPDAAAAEKISAYFKTLAERITKPAEPGSPNGGARTSSSSSASSPASPQASPAATSTSPSSTSASTQPTSSTPVNTASPSTPAATPAETIPPKQNAPITREEKAAAQPATTVPSYMPREKLDALSDAITTAIKAYGSTKPEMVKRLREWSGSNTFVSDAGQFSKEILPATWKLAVAGFKAWEAAEIAKRDQKAAGKSPEEVAEEAANEWEAASEGNAPQ